MIASLTDQRRTPTWTPLRASYRCPEIVPKQIMNMEAPPLIRRATCGKRGSHTCVYVYTGLFL
jgi:hypothetical protein